MKTTQYFGLPYFEDNDVTDPAADRTRFEIIDSQLYGLFSVFGNGVVSGWEVIPSSNLSISIGVGAGYINWTYAATTTPVSLDNLPPNSTVFIYAVASQLLSYSVKPGFLFLTTRGTDNNRLLLGSVTTNEQSVVSVDNTLKTNIGFLEAILNEIARHRHTGAQNEPTKIDLSKEVRGKLPGYRVSDLDASQITTGKFPVSRIPQIDHTTLDNAGVITHAQIDSFVQSLQNPNGVLLGEVNTINLLQYVLSMKHTIADFDDYFYNELAIIPGITNDSFIDYDATTAIVDKDKHEIKGIPAVTGTVSFFTASGASVFSKATKTNTDVDLLTGEVKLLQPVRELVIENFTEVKLDAEDIPGWTKTITSLSSSYMKGDEVRKYDDNPFAGNMHFEEGTAINFSKDLSGVNLNTYTKLDIAIRSASTTHPPITMRIVDSEETTDIIILEEDEITDGYIVKTFEIDEYSRSSVSSLDFVTSTDEGWNPLVPFDIFIGDITVRDELLYDAQGAVFLTYNTPQPSQWRSLSWSGDTPAGTSIRSRVRIANTESGLTNAAWSSYITVSGDVLSVEDSTYIQVEIQLLSNASRSSTPVLRTVKVGYALPSETDTFIINSKAGWDSGLSLINIDTYTVPSEIRILSPIRIGDTTYLTGSLLQQLDTNDVGVYGTTGEKLPLSPKQAVGIFNQTPSFTFPTDLSRLGDRTFLVSDTLNDRLAIVDKTGEVSSIYAANWVTDFNVAAFFPLGATYNRNKKLISVPLSKSIGEGTVNPAYILLRTRTTEYNLLPVDVAVNSDLNPFSGGSVVHILLSTKSAQFLETALVGDVYIYFQEQALPGKWDSNNAQYKAIANSLGLPITTNNVYWVDWLKAPVSASIRSDGDFLVCNSKTPSNPETNITSFNIIDPSDLTVSKYIDDIYFTLITLGGAKELPSKDILIAGLRKRTGALSIVVPEAATTDIKAIVENYVGVVVLVNRDRLNVIFEYTSSDGLYPSDAQYNTKDGTYVLSERAILTNNAGRIIAIDEDGNILRQFGQGGITLPNDVRILRNDNYLISV